MPGPGFPNLPPPFTLPPTPFRPVDVHGTPAPGGQSSSALPTGMSWYVRVGGSNLNGGSSTSLAAERSGANGAFININTTALTVTGGALTSADVGKGIRVTAGSFPFRFKIVAVIDATHATVDRAATATITNTGWAIGGAWADIRPAVGDAAQTDGSFLNSPVVSGDAVYIGAGTYRAVTVFGANWVPTQAGRVSFIGDVTGQFTGDAGMVQLTAYTTSDKIAPSAAALIATSNKSNLLFQNLFCVGILSIGTSQNVTVRNCAFMSQGQVQLSPVTIAGTPNSNILVEDCFFVQGSSITTNQQGVSVTLPSSSIADYDANVTVQNCVFYMPTSQGAAVTAVGTGALTFKGGGVRVKNCSAFFTKIMAITGTNTSTAIPCSATNCIMVVGNGNAISALVLGQLIEDYNLICCQTPRSNVTAGAHSISDGSFAPLFHFGQEMVWGGTQRPFGEPMQSSPLRQFGATDTGAGPLDVRGVPRPSAAVGWAVGAFERGNAAVQTQSVVESGLNAIQIVGSGSQDFDVPVDATATALSIWVRYDSNYVGPLPQIQVVKARQVGVGDYTLPVSTLSLNAWAQYTIPLINPTGAGIVTLRIVSGDTSGVGNVYADAFTVS